MTGRTSRTALVCSIVGSLIALGASAAMGGTIVGHVRYLGNRTVPPLRVPADTVAICGKVQPSPALIVGTERGLANAVVSVNGLRAATLPAPVNVSIHQTTCVFDPHVVAVPVGSSLTFVNTDVCLHNIHLMSGGATLTNIAMPLKGQESKLPVRILAKPGNVRFKCDVHAWMDGYVHVFEHPWFAVSDRHGAFRIPDVPPGTYDLQVQHELLGGSVRKVTVTAGTDTDVEVDLK